MKTRKPRKLATVPAIQASPDLSIYDRFVVAFSGGKDSLACLLHLLDQGVPADLIELWHHDVDGAGATFMDWPITPGYCRAVAAHFGMPIYFSWKEGGFLRELLRNEELTAPIAWEEPLVEVRAGVVPVVLKRKGGTRGKKNTRLKFPQKTSNLRTRWCSAYLKIDVARRILSNDRRFEESKTLLITGERAQESAARSRYKIFEPHEADNRKGRSARYVDRWRPVHSWTEEHVWAAIQNAGIRPHPAYGLGWGRVSCAACIFGSADQWASLRVVLPGMFEQIALLEEEFKHTIDRKRTIRELADKGTPYPATRLNGIVQLARCRVWPEWLPIKLDESDWHLPAGAFGDSAGPT